MFRIRIFFMLFLTENISILVIVLEQPHTVMSEILFIKSTNFSWQKKKIFKDVSLYWR